MRPGAHPKPKEGTIRIIDLSTAHPDNRLGAKEKTGFQHQRWTKDKFVNHGKPYKSKRDAEKARSSGQHSMQFEAVDPYKGHPRDAAKKKGYTLYHKSFTDAINHALAHHELNGHTISDDSRDRHIAMGPRKPSEGKTVSHNIPAEQKNRRIHMQIHNRGGKTPFELNTYSS